MRDGTGVPCVTADLGEVEPGVSEGEERYPRTPGASTVPVYFQAGARHVQTIPRAASTCSGTTWKPAGCIEKLARPCESERQAVE